MTVSVAAGDPCGFVEEASSVWLAVVQEQVHVAVADVELHLVAAAAGGGELEVVVLVGDVDRQPALRLHAQHAQVRRLRERVVGLEAVGQDAAGRRVGVERDGDDAPCCSLSFDSCDRR